MPEDPDDARDPAAPPVVGFDLDLTLIDTVPGFVATLDVLAAELGVDLPTDDLLRHLGPPLEQLLEPLLPAEQVGPAGDRFRAIYPDVAVERVPALPGAHDALAAVHDVGGKVVVVTGKHTPNAQRHLDHLDLPVDVLEGRVWGTGKADALRREGASVYVGDHVLDVEGALAADCTSVSVATGSCTAEELREAGTHVVLASLAEFPAWFAGHVLDQRLAALEAQLRHHGSVLVAFSGGADSALLLAAAVRALGPAHVVAATGYSDSLPQVERDPARAFAEDLGVEVLTPRTHEMERATYRANGLDRCFACKAELLDVLAPLAAERGLAVVATGTNADDARSPFRPGIRAAAERGAVTPLRDAGLTKAQVREASRRWGLPTWDKPAAACLSSRIAHGIAVTPHRLARVERAEAACRAVLPAVRDLRVRDLGEHASLEVDAALLPLAPELEQAVLDGVRAAGFATAEVDPAGFRSGSLSVRAEQAGTAERAERSA